MRENSYDVAIVGGGIVGLATALLLSWKSPGTKLLLLEKEKELAFHQTGHNSGTLHSGIYYRPGSLKAKLCVAGSRELVEFAKTQGIPYELCGKLVVATRQEELPRLAELYRRGTENGVPNLRRVGPQEIKAIEPHAQGMQALHVPCAGVIDFVKVARRYAQIIQESGAEIRLGTQVTGLSKEKEGFWAIQTDKGDFKARGVVNCAGLFADRIARKTGGNPLVQIIPFRGEYYELHPARKNLVRGLIYPVPDPRLPFLGVHVSRTIHGKVEIGPNAVLALKREGYRKIDLKLADIFEMLRFPGFWKMSRRFFKTGCEEWARSMSRKLFAKSVQRLVPDIEEKDLIPSTTGVRAQAVDGEGGLLDDFHLIQEERILHVVNAPSPAATASLAIGRHIADLALSHFNLQ